MGNRKTALLSVYNKQGIADFARELVALGWDIVSSGGTANELKNAGIAVRDVAEFGGGEAILGHRVVTLSREIHAALLSRDLPEDEAELEKIKVPRIDLVCVDLYPLEEEIKSASRTPFSVIEKTDIGGPTMLRSAAKGRRIVIGELEDRQKVLEWLKNGEPEKENFLNELAAKAEEIVARYVLVSADYTSQEKIKGFIGEKIISCQYGENPHQTPAALYNLKTDDPLALYKFKVISGMDPSYNNLCDLDRLLQIITHITASFDLNYNSVPFIAVAVKHGNPCGAAFGETPEEALKKMIGGDTRAIFGGMVMTNFPLDKNLGEILMTYLMPEGQRRLLDGVFAPIIEDETVEMLKRKGDKCRFIANPALEKLNKSSLDTANRFRYVRGGFLYQPNYTFILNFSAPELKKYGQLTPDQEKLMLLAWAISATSNSNTVTLAKDNYLIGDGVAQQDRVGACRVALMRANDSGHNTNGAVAASDSFFPFIDALENLNQAGVKTIFATSGSVNDEKIIKYCQENNLTLYHFPDKLGRGFFGH